MTTEEIAIIKKFIMWSDELKKGISLSHYLGYGTVIGKDLLIEYERSRDEMSSLLDDRGALHEEKD